MSKSEKIKRTILIALGFALATYLIMSALAILDKESAKSSALKSDTLSEVHSNTVQ
jgi:uncharacterized membrane protein